MSKGKFIAIEGPDGSGKTSIIKALGKMLENEGIQPVYTREPGGSPIAEQIRELILDVDNTAMDYRTEALLYAASRRQHLTETILPNVQAGRLVISDRFVMSSLAYQGVARKIGIEAVWQINQFAIEDHLPDLTILIDVPAEIGLERIEKARHSRQYDRLDREALAFHQKVRQTYLDLIPEWENIVVIDGSQSIEQVSNECFESLKEHGMIN
ncbi:dTMP kinase [Facklamia miroungae]|uniref:Thymidylate kinase n=1 Tax=Facklamia miroungae TaxID=120956 RepID=A0A1G7SN91_9LACT|nr:dTMP kinase [Facklamia miroungae]NKZ29597.1 dTMP kinase [Facklamia miroungae]SDG24314.1 dTMP kinase [Facklamia miroungae]